MSVGAPVMDVAARLCAKAGLAAPAMVERLAGGKNNRVFRVVPVEGPDVVLKSYFHDARDTRDRLKAEWEFLTHAWSVSVHVIPRPLAFDAEEHAGLYSFLKGSKLAASAVTAQHVDSAASFIVGVNRGISRAQIGLASEACFSMAQHLATVDRRVRRLSSIAEDAPYREEAQRFVSQQLQPGWGRVRDGVVLGAATASVAIDQDIPADDIILSPSDFGFHNVLLRPDGELQFLDFEYAGRDDVAKLAGDFYACPEIPTPQETFERFVDRLVALLGLSEAAALRARLLRDVYRVKWACIILNDFLPSDDARRAFATEDDRSERCLQQLRKAEAKLGEIG